MTTESTSPVIGAVALPQKPIRSELLTSRIRAAMWFLVPMIIALAVVAGWPLLRTIYFSFTDASLSHLDQAKFVGFNNYLRWTTLKSGRTLYGGVLADPGWWNAVWNTVRFAAISVVLSALISAMGSAVMAAGLRLLSRLGSALIAAGDSPAAAVPSSASAPLVNAASCALDRPATSALVSPAALVPSSASS